MRDLLPADRPVLILAPMQDVTDLPFLKIMAEIGGADVYVTEYFRVHPDYKPHPWTLRSIDENPTGKPIFAQMIGNDIPSLTRTAKQLMEHDVAGIDLNLGCPSPTVYRKCAGGGLLREPQRIDRILGALRDTVDGRFTVKTRLGFDSPDEFETLLHIFAKHDIDALTIHARTVVERYQTAIHPEHIKAAVDRLNCPVIANGNVVDVATGQQLLQLTGAAGLMLGRGAIRYPWIFDQFRALAAGSDPPQPVGRDLLRYIQRLWEETSAKFQPERFNPTNHVSKMKKYVVFIAQGVPGTFENDIRRVKEKDAFFDLCHQHLDNDRPLVTQPPSDSKLFCGFTDLLDGTGH